METNNTETTTGATEATEATERRRRSKEQGVLSKVWQQTGNTATNTLGFAENGTGILNDGLIVGREAIKPTLIDMRVETLNAMAQGIQDLMKMGIAEDEARAYLMEGIA